MATSLATSSRRPHHSMEHQNIWSRADDEGAQHSGTHAESFDQLRIPDHAVMNPNIHNTISAKHHSFSELRRLTQFARNVCGRLRSKDLVTINPVTQQELHKVHALLADLYYNRRTQQVLGDLGAILKMRSILEMIYVKEHNFPPAFQQMARAIYDNYEGRNWGEPSFEPQMPSSGSAGPSRMQKKRRASSAETNLARLKRAKEKSIEGVKKTNKSKVVPKSKKVKHDRNSDADTSSFIVSDSNDGSDLERDRARTNKKVTPAPEDHPIFGKGGIMHHIYRHKGKAYSFRIDPKYKLIKKSASEFGHNGLSIGQCWPMRLAAVRDGAHGKTVAGIDGNHTEGAYSVVIARLYEAVDEDHGDEVFYSAPYGYSTSDKKADPEKAGARFLLKSIDTKNPVRVLRHASAKWAGSPKKGLRYDGLYEVLSAEERINAKGGVYASFRLVRLKDQDPIAVDEPGEALMEEFKLVKQGY